MHKRGTLVNKPPRADTGASRQKTSTSAQGRMLLTADQAAREVFGVSERKFHDLRKAAWMPRPVVLGERCLRWVRTEIESAAANMPRQAEPAPAPAQLTRKRKLAEAA